MGKIMIAMPLNYKIFYRNINTERFFFYSTLVKSSKQHSNNIISDKQARVLCDSVLKNIKLLVEKRDMTLEEIKLTISIESPSLTREITNSHKETEVSREEVASAFMDVVTGKIPKDKTALKVL